MKKLVNKISLIGTSLAIAATVVSCSQDKATTSTDSPTESTTTTQAKPEIVYVNSDSLLNNYEYFKQLKTQFESKSKQAQADLTAKGTAFQREVAAYQQNAANLSADQRASTEERLARKQQELATYNQNAGNALANEEAAENEKLYNKVSEYLKGYAKGKGYKLVLTYSKSNPTVLYADQTLDVTTEVVKGLNEQYKKEKK